MVRKPERGGIPLTFFPLIAWERISNTEANAKCVEWRHYLGGCNRPFGRISFGLFVCGELVSVAIAAFLVKRSIYTFARTDCCELARLCTHPDHRDMTRVALRLFRKTIAEEWTRAYFPPQALLSYHRRDTHKGDIYRFDGWMFLRWTRAGRVGEGSGHSTPQIIHAKGLWCYPLTSDARNKAAAVQTAALKDPAA